MCRVTSKVKVPGRLALNIRRWRLATRGKTTLVLLPVNLRKNDVTTYVLPCYLNVDTYIPTYIDTHVDTLAYIDTL